MMIVLYVVFLSIAVLEPSRYLLRQRGYVQHWQFTDTVRLSVAMVFVVIGLSHFSALKFDMLAMLPPPVPAELWVIYLTGVCELAGAVGLLYQKTRTLACVCLMLLLLCVFPANIYAALHQIPFNGRPATPLPLRTLIQLLLLGLLTWLIRLEQLRSRSEQNSKEHSYV
jgi:uncharacterized membrane protein